MFVCWETVFTTVKGQPQYPFLKKTSETYGRSTAWILSLQAML